MIETVKRTSGCTWLHVEIILFRDVYIFALQSQHSSADIKLFLFMYLSYKWMRERETERERERGRKNRVYWNLGDALYTGLHAPVLRTVFDESNRAVSCFHFFSALSRVFNNVNHFVGRLVYLCVSSPVVGYTRTLYAINDRIFNPRVTNTQTPTDTMYA